MKRLFILGAGASRDLEFKFTTIDGFNGTVTTSCCQGEGPLSLGFFYDSNLLINKINENIAIPVSPYASQRLQDYVCGYYRNKTGRSVIFEEILNNKVLSKEICIEDLYIDIERNVNDSEEKGEIPTEEEAKLWAIQWDLENYYYTSLSIICNFCFSIYHSKLAQYVLNCGGNIISFNWDILLDEAMQYTGSWDYLNGYAIDFKKIIYKDGNAPDFKANNTLSNVMLKPHGSINWYRKSNNGEDPYLLIYPLSRNMRGGNPTIYLRNTESDRDSNIYRSAVLPPGKDREAFPCLWTKIREIMEEADEIVIIGFKFKGTDSHFRKEIKQYNLKKDVKIQLVDPKANELIPVFKDIFSTNNIAILSPNFKKYCEHITKDNLIRSR